MHQTYNMHEGLLRQRRNLIITSVILWFLKYGKVSLSKISIAGFDIAFENPNVLTLSLWLAFAYFYFRYYQYFVEEGLIFFQDKLTRAKIELLLPLLRDQAQAQHPTLIFDENALRYDSYMRDNRMLRGASNNQHSSTTLVDVQVPWLKYTYRTILALLKTTFRSSAVTDYLLPFALADFVLYYCGLPDWGGSYIKLIFNT